MKFCEILGLPIFMSSDCLFAMKVRRVAKHLRLEHGYGNDEALKVENGIADSEVHWDSDKCAIERELYLSNVDKTGMQCNETQQVLSTVVAKPDLKIREAFKCPKCGYIPASDGTIRKHMGTCHSSGEVVKALNVQAQTVFLGQQDQVF